LLWFVLIHSHNADKVGCTGKRPWLSLLGLGAMLCLPRPVVADSRSALVMVTVRVVESCRVETSTTSGSGVMDLQMRCNSKSRPSLGLATSSQSIAPVGSVTLLHSELATTSNGKTLNIEF
jgi:hypothetical protein